MTSRLHAFQYDPFQQRALELIDQDHSLFVAAPTGSGKTVLADYVIEQTLKQHRRVIYTAPIKALSNQKFRDFSVRHGTDVGIMTGDVTLNPQAPLIIMTTEIYRNTLLEDPNKLSHYAWIIFDEIHYLDDPQRGTVWEEALIFTPNHIKLLCLSATIPNVQELAHWIRQVHERPIEVIEETRRPIPLSVHFQCQNRIFTNLETLKQEGFQPQEVLTRAPWRHGDRMRRSERHEAVHKTRYPNRVQNLIQTLREEEHLPCIWFTFGRRHAEELASELVRYTFLSPEERTALREMYRSLCSRFQLIHDRSAESLARLIECGVAYHHAGMMPAMKEVIERCFARRLIKVIVTTETFALGINMPARCVVLDTLKKRSGSGFELLRRREFMQMAGRAGRRGMDAFGVVYLRVNPTHVSYSEIERLLDGSPEPVQSHFNMTYATLLNLFRRHGQGLLEVFPKTLFSFQTSGERREAGLELIQKKLELLQVMGYLDPVALTPKGSFASWLYGYELLLTELYSQGHLSLLDSLSLAILVAAIVYEPRPTATHPKRHRYDKRLRTLCEEVLVRIHKEEARLHIYPKTKAPAFHLSHALDAWMQGSPFYQLTKYCDVDEGEIVRYFRMSVQLLRQLSESPESNLQLSQSARKAMQRINRDVIDAEIQLRMGSVETA